MVSYHSGAGIAAPRPLSFPDKLWSTLGPGLQEIRFFGDRSSVGSPECRPIARIRRCRDQEPEQCDAVNRSC